MDQEELSKLNQRVEALAAQVAHLTGELGERPQLNLREFRRVLEQALARPEPTDLGEIDILSALTLTGCHCQTPLLLLAVTARLPIWLYGDAGSGKSFAAMYVAQELNLPFGTISVCPSTSKADLLGYMDAGGTYRPTEFRRRYEEGGVFLLDEIDNGSAQILAVLNNALSNDLCAFPDQMVRRHPNCVVIAAANTIGRGANVRYIGRSPVDATTLDRFVFLEMQIDENLENALAGLAFDPEKLVNPATGGRVGIEGWVAYVRSVRQACADLGMDVVISPRAILHGLQLLRVGVGAEHAKTMCVWKGMRPSDKERVLNKMRTAA